MKCYGDAILDFEISAAFYRMKSIVREVLMQFKNWAGVILAGMKREIITRIQAEVEMAVLGIGGDF